MSKTRTYANGRAFGGKPIGRGALYLMLGNRLYLGEITHRGSSYPGQHAAIIDTGLWEAVQLTLVEHRHERNGSTSAQDPSLLAGLIVDETGDPMTPSHAVKGGKRYRYYVSKALLTAARAKTPHGRRIPAGEIETLIIDRLIAFLESGHELHDAIGKEVPNAALQQHLMDKARELATSWRKLPVAEKRRFLASIVQQIVVCPDRVDICLDSTSLVDALTGEAKPSCGRLKSKESAKAGCCVTLAIPASLKRAGIGKRLIIKGQHNGVPDQSLVKLLVKALDLQDKLVCGSDVSLDRIAAQESITSSYATRLLRLSFLAPQIVRNILDGRHSPTLTARQLMLDTKLPLTWTDQAHVIGNR